MMRWLLRASPALHDGDLREASMLSDYARLPSRLPSRPFEKEQQRQCTFSPTAPPFTLPRRDERRFLRSTPRPRIRQIGEVTCLGSEESILPLEDRCEEYRRSGELYARDEFPSSFTHRLAYRPCTYVVNSYADCATSLLFLTLH